MIPISVLVVLRGCPLFLLYQGLLLNLLGLAVQLLSNVVEDVERVALGTAEAALRESSSATTSMRFLENEEDEEKSSLLEISQSKA